MAAPSAPTAPRFSPVERPRAAISTDGTLAAIVESQRVVVLELPGGEPFAEVGVDPSAAANEVAWVGAPPRLFVLSRYAEHTRVHLVDPHGPRSLADLRIESPMRLAATCGAHALVVSPQSALIVSAADNLLVSVAYPARAVPAHAGAAGTNFLVAHADSVEEWDPQARMPKRRLKLPRTATITALGGSDRVVWMTTQQEPARLDVLALVDRGQPKAHDLPEPIVYATGHPRSDLVVCIGESGKIYVVDLDGRSKLKTLVTEGLDEVQAAGLIVGRVIGVLAAQAERPVRIITLEGHTPEPESAPHTNAGAARSSPTPAPASRPAQPSMPAPAAASPSNTASASGSGAVPAVGDAPLERKKPPPPPPARSGTTMPPPVGGARSTGSTVPPPMAASSHATGAPIPPMSSGASSSSVASGAASGSASSGVSGPPNPSSEMNGASAASGGASSAVSSGLSLPAIAPGSSSLARPATRAFARAPTPHPRASSEGVDVDLEGVFDELSADAANNERTASPVTTSEQFDSPLAFEARPVADHVEPNDGGEKTAPPTLTDPRPVPDATDRAKASRNSPSDAKPAATPDARKPGSKAGSKPGEARANADATSLEPVTPIDAPPSMDDDDEDLAPPTLMHDESRTLARETDPRAPMRESGPMRMPPRDSSLSPRDAPLRKPARREVTVREAPPLPVAKPAWRDQIVYWTYEVFDGVVERGAPIASPLDDLAERFGVPDTILPALVVLYGAHLAGERGVAPVHIARVVGSWDEALGRGLLAGRGLATFVESRVRIAGPIQRFLDEVAVETGALVGMSGHIALPGPHAVIAAAETPLKVVAVRWLAEVGGAILAAHDDADLAELFVEARARGAAPMFRIGADELLELGTDPAILVVTDEEVAESLGVPRLG